MFHATLDHVEDTAHNIKTFYFKPEHPVDYIAGQFIELYLPHPNADERGEKHWFTLSSSPTEPLLTITTKFATDRSSTFKQTLRALAIGTRVKMADPMGDFVLPKDKSLPLLFVAAGIGVTPMHSMVKFLSDTHEQRSVRLINAVNHDDELAFRELFQHYLGDDFMPIVKEPSDSWAGETGSLSVPRILEAIGKTDDSIIYLAGPEPMVETFNDQLQAAGINQRRIITDFFPGYAAF